MLNITPKVSEIIVLRDGTGRTVATIQPFNRGGRKRLELGFDLPDDIQLKREGTHDAHQNQRAANS